MQHWLRNPKEPISRDDNRVEKLGMEFGLNLALCNTHKEDTNNG